MKNDEKQMSFIFMDDTQNWGEKVNKGNFQNNTASLYEKLREKIADTFNLYLWLAGEDVKDAIDSKRPFERAKNLYLAQEKINYLGEYATLMQNTYSKKKFTEYDYKRLENLFGKEVSDYERFRRDDKNE